MNTTLKVAIDLEIDLSDSSLIRIDSVNLKKIATQISTNEASKNYKPYTWDDDNFWNASDSKELRSQFFCLGNAINFQFRKFFKGKWGAFGGRKEGVDAVGSMYMWRCLRVALKHEIYPVLDAKFLKSVTMNEVEKLFQSDDGSIPLIPSIEERVANLRDLGNQLEEHWGGNFYNLVLASENSLIKFSAFSRKFRAFNDPIHKLTMVNAILHSGNGICSFQESILPGIDYHLMKQLLRMGILVPNLDLSEKLEKSNYLSEFEVQEIRRVALKALIMISEKTGLSGEILDNQLWLNKKKCEEINPVCTNEEKRDSCPFYGACKQKLQFGIPLAETRYF